MTRSRVLSGHDKQLNRAKQRRRNDRATAVPTEHGVRCALEAHLAKRFSALTIEEVERLDLNGYLRETSAIALEAWERLRYLAIELELAVPLGLRGWRALKRIYDEAGRLAGDDDARTNVLHSTSISAHALIAGQEDDQRLWRAAYDAAFGAIALSPLNASCHALLAHHRYHDSVTPKGGLDACLLDCARAIELDPRAGWPRYHRAFALRDLGRFAEALAAFDEINLGLFDNRPHRRELILESRAYCRLRSGDREGAINEFRALLARYERDPSLARDASWLDLVDVATGELVDELGARTKGLIERHADYLLEDFDDVDDDPDFLELVRLLLSGLVQVEAPRAVALVKVGRRFSKRWRGFNGRWRRASREVLCIPPFTPAQVVSEQRFASAEAGPGHYRPEPHAPRIHRDERSAEDCPRLISREYPHSAWLWYSGGTINEDRASIMVYLDGRGGQTSWHLEFEHAVEQNSKQWRLSKQVGIGTKRVADLLELGSSTEEWFPWTR